MKKTTLFLALILFSLASAFGQRYTISGVMKDSANGETLKDIWVMLIPIEDATQSFTGTSNLAGFYSITAHLHPQCELLGVSHDYGHHFVVTKYETQF